MFSPHVFMNRTTLFLLILVTCSTLAGAQINFTGPQPGDVYREYSRRMTDSDHNWRVTDPNTTLGTADLPNAILGIRIDDLQGAIRAEAVISMWGGHVGTTGKAIQFNGRNWLPIPELGTQNGIPAGHEGEYYMSQPTVTLPIPLSQLVQGDNTFQGTNTGQAPKYSFHWGAFGWYNIIIRVYYDPATKAHPTGYISSPTSGSSFGENPTITTTITGGSVNRVDFIGSYYGYDTDGDGISTGYHYDYQAPYFSYPTVDIHNHVGTATGSPWQVTWRTDWVPDQAAGGVKLLARIRDNSGVWYCSPEVSSLSLTRNGTSVQMFQSTPPERCWAQGGVGEQNLPVNVPSIQGATSAVYMIRSWNMPDILRENPQDAFPDWRKLNSWTDDNNPVRYGNDHYYSFDVRPVPLNVLVQGTNTFHFYASVSNEHGIEILWPGPALLIRYNGTPSNNPPSITQHPVNQTVGEGATATFTVAAIGSGTLGYQWQKNNSNISGANGPTYTTPPVALSDNNSTFRCLVTNSYGSATSNDAKLFVTTGGGGGGGTNVLVNGSFESGTSNWSFYTNGVGGLSTVMPGTNGSSAARISISVAGTNVQFYEAGITLEPATQYTLSFDAYANAARTIAVSLGQHGSPYANYGIQKSPFSLGTSWQSFSLTFTTTGFSSTVNDGRLMFWLADVDAAGDQYTFDNVVLSKAGGSTPTKPAITGQPGNQIVTEGQTASFTVIATGAAPLSYQWQKNSADIIGATNATYTTPAVALTDNNAKFRCVVTNNSGTATSNEATLTVNPAGGGGVNILSNGSFESGTTSWSFYTNGSGTFTTVSPGTNGASAARIAIAAAGTNVQLSQFNFALEANTQYTLSFDAYASASRSIKVSLLKHVSPYGNYGLNNQLFTLGTAWQTFSVTFTTSGFSATVNDPRLMFWFADADAAGDQFFIDNVVLSKPGGGTPVKPAISSQPTNQSAAVGQTATFAVVATGTAPLSYQWQKNESDISGATGSSYTTPALTLADNGATFRCIVTNNLGSATSNAATLTVTAGGGGGTNVLANGSFESGTTGWNFYTNGAGGFATVAPGTNGSSAGRVSISAAGTNVQLYQYGFTLEAGTVYSLSFDAYANAPRTISVSVGKHVTPYGSYGLSGRAVALGTSWQSYSITFTASGFSGTATDPRLMFWLADVDAAGDQYTFDNFVLSKAGSGSPSMLTTGVVTEELPKATGISDIYPNPFNPSTNIRYTLLEPAVITVRVYSVLGQEVATLVNGAQGAGIHTIVWDGRNSNGTPMGSGVYLCRMTGAGERGQSIMSVKRMMLVK